MPYPLTHSLIAIFFPSSTISTLFSSIQTHSISLLNSYNSAMIISSVQLPQSSLISSNNPHSNTIIQTIIIITCHILASIIHLYSQLISLIMDMHLLI